MKTLLKHFGPAFLAMGLSFTSLAQSSVGINTRLYGLTNTTGWLASSNTTLTILGNMTTNVTSNPFPIYKDRGFYAQISCAATDSTASAAFSAKFDTAPATNGPWTTTHPLVVTAALNGTNAVVFGTNVPKSAVDNVYWCRVSQFQNAHSNAVQLTLGATNTFVSVFP